MVDSGQSLSHYTILRPLGKGGMGEVFLAEDTVLGRKVALKFLAKDAITDPVARGRFLREAKSAAAIDDPFICKIYETGEVDGEPFIAMEYIEGESLGARIAREPMSLEEVVTTASEIAEALGVAHEHGIIHRDLKPSNIMLTTQGHAKVLDFGLAKQVFSPGEMDTSADTAIKRRSHRPRSHPRHAFLHVSRTAAGTPADPEKRCLFVRNRPPRNADRRAPLCSPNLARNH